MNNMRTYLDILNEQNAKSIAAQGLNETVAGLVKSMGLGAFLVELGKAHRSVYEGSSERVHEDFKKIARDGLIAAAMGALAAGAIGHAGDQQRHHPSPEDSVDQYSVPVMHPGATDDND